MVMSVPYSVDLSQARLGVLGGSGLYAMEGLEDIQELNVDTPFGAPSDQLRLGRLEEESLFYGRPLGARTGRVENDYPGCQSS